MKSWQGILCCLLAGCALGVAQTPGASSSAGVQGQIVSLPVLVTDEANHSVDDLVASELQIFEDGKPQQLLSLTKDTRPVKYVIAIDASLSFKDLLAPSIAACTQITNSNGPEDEVALIRFVSSEKINVQQEFTADKSRLIAALNGLFVGGGQSAVIDGIYLAVQMAASYKEPEFSGRRAVILVSDGEDRHSFYTMNQLGKLLRKVNVQVFAIGIVAKLDNDAGRIRLSKREVAEKLLTKLVQETGGRVFLPKGTRELRTAVEEIAHDLHTPYLVSYRAPDSKAKEFHKVEIEYAGKRKLTAITRPGYFAH